MLGACTETFVMKPNIPLLAGLALIAAGGLHAQDLNLKPAPPPPGIHDKGATPVANPPPEKNRPAVDLPAMHDNGTDANGNPPPRVTVRTEGEDTVEEYREGGRITMIRITPKHGPPREIMADENGKLERDPKLGPVAPVYYKVYEWGAAPKTVDEQKQQ